MEGKGRGQNACGHSLPCFGLISHHVSELSLAHNSTSKCTQTLNMTRFAQEIIPRVAPKRQIVMSIAGLSYARKSIVGIGVAGAGHENLVIHLELQ
jgi:hypothetical protein